MFIESDTSDSFSTRRKLYVTICDADWFSSTRPSTASVILSPVTQSVALTALATQICACKS